MTDYQLNSIFVARRKMIIQKALPDDALEIEKLYKILVPNDMSIAVTSKRIEEILNSDTNELLVVKGKGKIQGTAFITFCLDPMYDNLPYAVIENIIVAPSSRRNGVGRKLMDEIENRCWLRKCTKIMLLSSVHREDAHKFFNSNGFSESKKKGFVKYRSGKYDSV